MKKISNRKRIRKIPRAIFFVATLLALTVVANSVPAEEGYSKNSSSQPLLPKFQVPNQSNVLVLRVSTFDTPMIVTEDENINSNPIWLRDESGLIFESDRDGDFELYQYDFIAKTTISLTENNAIDREPTLHPTENRLLFTSDRDDELRIYETELDEGETSCLTCGLDIPGYHYSPTYADEGQAILFVCSNKELTYSTLYRLTRAERSLASLTTELGIIDSPQFDPIDGSIYFGAEPHIDRYRRLWVLPKGASRILFESNSIGGQVYHQDLTLIDGKPKLVFSTSVDHTAHGHADRHDVLVLNPQSGDYKDITQYLTLKTRAGYYYPALSPSGEQVALASYRNKPETVARHKWASDIREWSRYIHNRKGWFILGKHGEFISTNQSGEPFENAILVMPGDFDGQLKLVHMGPSRQGTLATVASDGSIELVDNSLDATVHINFPQRWPIDEANSTLSRLKNTTIYSSRQKLDSNQVEIVKKAITRIVWTYDNTFYILGPEFTWDESQIYALSTEDDGLDFVRVSNLDATTIFKVTSTGQILAVDFPQSSSFKLADDLRWPFYHSNGSILPPFHTDFEIDLLRPLGERFYKSDSGDIHIVTVDH